MKPWELLGSAALPSTTLSLHRRGSEFVIRVGGAELMNSKAHTSELALGTLGCAHCAKYARPRVVIGGLGMGFTLRAVLDTVGPGAVVDVVELVPEVVTWNAGVMAEVNGEAMKDPRVRIHTADVGEFLDSAKGVYDAVLLDVDNGPQALTTEANAGLYSVRGLARLVRSLRSGGVMGLWSAGDDPPFRLRLERAGFRVTEEIVRGQGGRGRQYRVWLGRAP